MSGSAWTRSASIKSSEGKSQACREETTLHRSERVGNRTDEPLLAKQRNKIYVIGPFGLVGSYRTQVGPKFRLHFGEHDFFSIYRESVMSQRVFELDDAPGPFTFSVKSEGVGRLAASGVSTVCPETVVPDCLLSAGLGSCPNFPPE